MELFRFDTCNKLRAFGSFSSRFSSKLAADTLVLNREHREFMDVFPQIVRDLTETEEYADVPQVNKWFAKVLEWNVPNGNKNRSTIIKQSYKALEDPNRLTTENIKLSDILGWCFEINQSAIFMLDDIYDASETRRYKKCWHKLNGVRAVNDSMLLENSVFRLLKRYFLKHPSYVSFIELFHKNTLMVAMGQTLEDTFISEGKTDINSFTLNRYGTLVGYKTEPYAFIFPMQLAMHLANKFDPVMHRKLEPILREMGNLIQVTNDFTDCYGNPDDTGKIGTDIQEGKFSWMITVAMGRASGVQRKILSENYGRNRIDAVWKVKKVYDELELDGVFAKHEEEKLALIRSQIRRISEEEFPYKLFLEYLESIVDENNWRKKIWWRL